MHEARFVSGSIMKHISVMTFTATLGLMALFVVDLVDMYFLSLLGEVELAAAIGYAGSILFITTSVSIGLTISVAALVARSMGAQQVARARRLAASSFVFTVLVTVPMAAIVWWFAPELLSLLGAEGRAHELGLAYLRIILPFMPTMALGMASGGVLRAVGAARQAMTVTLCAGAVNAILDPIFIFGFGLGIRGAAIASVCAHITMLLSGLYFIKRKRDLLGELRWQDVREDYQEIVAIAGPAMLTNVATPVANAYVTAALAEFGDGAVAGNSIISRVIPVAFGVVFALSGAVGPIAGQNYGARDLHRVRRTLVDALIFCCVVVAAICASLYLLRDALVAMFSMQGAAAELIIFFCTFVAASYLFHGSQFVANAFFNNLGKPRWSTLSNWGKATVGTIPLVWLGGEWYGAPGVLAGQGIGALLFGAGATWMAFRLVARL